MRLLLYRLFGRFGLYTAVVFGILLANLQGPALTEVFGLKTSLGNILYSGIYFATDLLGEKYGRKEASRAVMLGFCASLMLLLFTQIGLAYPPAVGEVEARAQANYNAMETLFGFYPRILFGSLLAYLVTQNLDVWLFHLLRYLTSGRHLWLRNNLSTMTSQAVDTLLFSFVVWGPLFSVELVLELAVSKYLFKVIIALADTPLVYLARSWPRPEDAWATQTTPGSQAVQAGISGSK